MNEQTKNPQSKDVKIPVPAKPAEKHVSHSSDKPLDQDNAVIGDEAVHEKQIAHATGKRTDQSKQSGERELSNAARDQAKYDLEKSRSRSTDRTSSARGNSRRRARSRPPDLQ